MKKRLRLQMNTNRNARRFFGVYRVLCLAGSAPLGRRTNNNDRSVMKRRVQVALTCLNFHLTKNSIY